MAKKASSNRKRAVAKPKCFVIMPFTHAASPNNSHPELDKDQLDTVFAILKTLLTRQGYDVRRSEGKGDILREIVFELDSAELVCADLTGLNPNVMYELGIRHGFTKKTILLTQAIADLPFDLSGYHCIAYGWQTKKQQDKFARDVRDTLKRISSDPDTRFGPVHTHLGTKHLGLEDEERRTTLKKLGALASELGHLWNAVKDVHKILMKIHPNAFTETRKGWRLHTENLDLHRTDEIWAQAKSKWASSYPAIDLLLSTRYIPDRFDQFGDISAFLSTLGSFRFNMASEDRSLMDFFQNRIILDALTDDIVTLLQAVKDGMYGEELGFECRKISQGDRESELVAADKHKTTGKTPRKTTRGTGNKLSRRTH